MIRVSLISPCRFYNRLKGPFTLRESDVAYKSLTRLRDARPLSIHFFQFHAFYTVLFRRENGQINSLAPSPPPGMLAPCLGILDPPLLMRSWKSNLLFTTRSAKDQWNISLSSSVNRPLETFWTGNEDNVLIGCNKVPFSFLRIQRSKGPVPQLRSCIMYQFVYM